MAAKWGEISAEEIQKAVRGNLAHGDSKKIFDGISTDSRKISAGDLYWPLKGERYDGHDFIVKAFEMGAIGSLMGRREWDERSDIKQLFKTRFNDKTAITVKETTRALGDLANWWREQHDVRVAAITGSAGKTTTKEMASSILSRSGRTLKNEGNFNNLVGLPLTLLKLSKDFENVVLEMGMNRPGEILRLTEIADPDLGVITNVGMAHLEGVGDISGVAGAKAELAEKISPEGAIIINGDYDLLIEAVRKYRDDFITFGLKKDNDVYACCISDLGIRGVTFDLRYGKHSLPVQLKIPGIQNVVNALAAASIAIKYGISEVDISEGLKNFSGIEGRFNVIRLPDEIIVVDDTYNANPMSLAAAFQSMNELCRGINRVIIGLGDMLELGEATEQAHRQAGAGAARAGAKYFIVMGDHANEMVEGALSEGFPKERIFVVQTHSDMTKIIREKAKKSTLIFLKGSHGMRLDKVIADLAQQKN